MALLVILVIFGFITWLPLYFFMRYFDSDNNLGKSFGDAYWRRLNENHDEKHTR